MPDGALRLAVVIRGLIATFNVKLEQCHGCSVWCVEAKKFCWYFEERYPAYFVCRSYEDCCGTRCCVRALSIQRLWYFWVLLMMGVLFCCGAGFFIRRRMYPSHLRDEPNFNVSFTRHPVTTPEPVLLRWAWCLALEFSFPAARQYAGLWGEWDDRR
ncbi:vesicular, overexpressed in cancer, prosurvival protein 1 isoform X4 [Fundulus heteroclitus]|uniref:vesicular, overexpressed in cancer, prosurvival protein 1 isoform X4 n=1 Tax=Fundulus heteroclitus TaxID=8078 RepID=UPI00165B0DE8|nr:vesicular, overexpressed in cancer, prosurvival protein 1 isoform X4 [Fundulus heteroclitus]